MDAVRAAPADSVAVIADLNFRIERDGSSADTYIEYSHLDGAAWTAEKETFNCEESNENIVVFRKSDYWGRCPPASEQSKFCPSCNATEDAHLCDYNYLTCSTHFNGGG